MPHQRLGLGSFQRRGIDHDQAAVLGFRRERMAQSERTNLLRQRERMRPHDRTEGTATAAELRHAGRTVTSTAGALLLVHLLAGAPDVRTALRLVGAGLTLGELPVDAALDDVLARLETENGVGKLDRAGFLALKGGDFQFHLTRPP